MLLCTRTFPRKLLIHAGVEKAGESLPLSAADSRFVAESILCSFVQQSGGVALPVGSALAQACSQEAGAPSTLGSPPGLGCGGPLGPHPHTHWSGGATSLHSFLLL